MTKSVFFKIIIAISLIISIEGCKQQEKALQNVVYSKVNFEYSPKYWQTCIGLPDDAQKSMVGKYGQLLYEYHRPFAFNQFNTEIVFNSGSAENWISQKLLDAKVPIVVTRKEYQDLDIQEFAFTIAPPLINVHSDSASTALPKKRNGELKGSPRNDIVIIHLKNNGIKPVTISPDIKFNTTYSVKKESTNVNFNDILFLNCSEEIENIEITDTTLVNRRAEYYARKGEIELNEMKIATGEEKTIVFQVGIGKDAIKDKISPEKAQKYKNQAIEYWSKRNFPYRKIIVPDTGVQNLLHSSIRNIMQAREIKNGLPAYQVGPTTYRGLWIVDGSFLFEAMTYLGEIEDVRNGIEYMMSFQKKDGSFELIRQHWKETGIVLWAVTNHARLTGDMSWLESHWTKLENAFAYIDTLRMKTHNNPDALNYDLIPKGFSDGGLRIKVPEYTNIYWTLIGMKSAIESAKWLNKMEKASEWQKKYDLFYSSFRKAAQRDMKKDQFGNEYLPILMPDSFNINPARAQWAFCHAVYPGQIFEKDDSLVIGNMAMLEAAEAEGLIYETGWLNEGVWNYFGSFFAHSCLWLNHPQKAVDAMYAVANHASPTLVWREEQPIQESNVKRIVGDMPHNWASAEFIRMIRNFLVLERGNELHLFEALPEEWTQAGMKTELNQIYTDFGIISLSLEVNSNRTKAYFNLKMESDGYINPAKIIIHNEMWNSEVANLELKPKFPIEKIIDLK